MLDSPQLNDFICQISVYIETLNRWQVIDFICQALILIFGLGAILMVSGLKNKWGNVVGLAHQPFWFFTTLYHQQWVLFLMSLIYTIIWSIGIWKWFFKSKIPTGV